MKTIWLRLISLAAALIILVPLNVLAAPAPGETISGTGTIEFQEIEGGFYGLIMDDGTKLLPVNLTDEFKINGTYVLIEATATQSQESIYMWGTLVELDSIELVNQSCTSCATYWWAYMIIAVVLAAIIFFGIRRSLKSGGGQNDEEKEK